MLLFIAAAFATFPAGIDTFDDAPSSFPDGTLERSYGTVVAESLFGAPTGYMERYDDPSEPGYVVATYGDSFGVDFDAPVSSFRAPMHAQNCSGYYDPRTSSWDPTASIVLLEVRDTSGNTIEYVEYDWVFDPTAPLYHIETCNVDVDYSRPTADIGGFRVHWGDAYYLHMDNFEYGAGVGAGPQPQLDITGTCPGLADFSFSGFTPGGTVELASASSSGSFTIPRSHPCGPLATELGPNVRVRLSLTADANGEVDFSRDFRNSGVCSAYMQAIDVSSCTLTPLVHGIPSAP